MTNSHFTRWHLGGNIMVQGYVDDEGRSIVWYPAYCFGPDEATLCIFREDDEEWIDPILSVPCESLQAAIDILSNDPTQERA